MFLHSYMYKNNGIIDLIIVRQFETPFGKKFNKKYIRHFNSFEHASAFQQLLQ